MALEQVTYEGYAQHGVALMIEVVTDNRNRAVAALRHVLTRSGGNLGESGSVAYLFDRVGMITYPAAAADADAVFEGAVEAGADDVESSGDGHEIICAPEALHEVAKALEGQFGDPQSARLGWRPQNMVPLDEAGANSLFKLLETLDDNDDVQQVSANFEVADDLMEKLSA